MRHTGSSIKEYVTAKNVEEAVALGRKGYVFLAGGTQVNSTPFKQRGRPVEKVVSLSGLDINEIRLEGESVVLIGAGVTLQELADSLLIPDALRTAAGYIPTRSVRNIATIGGNVGANRPDSYLIPALCALNASALLADGDSVPVIHYIAENRNDLILRFILPPEQGTCLALKESRSHLALPVVSAAVRIDIHHGRITSAGIYAGCVDQRVIHLKPVEDYLVSLSGLDHQNKGDMEKISADLEQKIGDSISPTGDYLGSAEFKLYLNQVVIADGIQKAIREALL